MSAGQLGRRPPTDWTHVERYPLTAAPTANVPVVIGCNWYAEFDHPQDGWIARDGRLTSIRGGHCVCLEPVKPKDTTGWWGFYDQGQEGSCVGFGWSRAMSLLNRRRYDARWLYCQAQDVDEYADTPPAEGTSVRAGGNVLAKQGHVPMSRGKDQALSPQDGIAVYRWARNVDDVLQTLGTTADHVTLLNSWGRDYPHRVRMPAEVLDRLLQEDGELAIPTDR